MSRVTIEKSFDLQMDDPKQPLLPKTTVTTAETSLSILDDDGKSITYNTSDNSHLSTDANFETIVPFSGEGKSLGGATARGATRNKKTYVNDASRKDYTDVTKEEINSALISSRKGPNIKGWKTTKEGIENMLNYVWKKDGNIYLWLDEHDGRTAEYILTYKEQGNNIVKFYAKSRLEEDYGKDIAELVELLFTDPE